MHQRNNGLIYYVFVVFILKVVDCRVCGDPNSVLRFAFVEFTDEGMSRNLIIFLNKCVLLYASLILLPNLQKGQGMP